MIQRCHALADALLALERELRELGLWAAQPPSAVQLASREPFCVDTLAFEGWLQWVFIPRMSQLVEQGGPLPAACNLQPMGEEAFVHLGRQRARLQEVLGMIDRTICQ